MSVFQFLGVVLVLWLACTATVAVFFARARRSPGSSPYPPEAAEAPVARGESLTVDGDGYLRATPWVAGDHPKDCADDCCIEVRMQELVDAYDWDAAEKDIARPRKGRAR